MPASSIKGIPSGLPTTWESTPWAAYHDSGLRPTPYPANTASNGKREKLSARQKKGPCHPIVSLVSFGFAFCLFASAQTVGPPPAIVEAQTIPSPDALGRTTPRGTVVGFLKTARKGDDDAATQYLNTQRRGKAADNLAHELFVIIDRRLPARLNQLSDRPALTSPGKPDQDLVGTISSESGNIDLLLERRSGGPAYLVVLRAYSQLRPRSLRRDGHRILREHAPRFSHSNTCCRYPAGSLARRLGRPAAFLPRHGCAESAAQSPRRSLAPQPARKSQSPGSEGLALVTSRSAIGRDDSAGYWPKPACRL